MALNHKGNVYQPFSAQKKKQSISILAALMAVIMGVAGYFGIKKIDFTSIGKEETTTKAGGNTNNTEINEALYEGLVLTDDFDINNKEAVKKRATQIYNISDKSISVKEIMNLIYHFNGAFDKLMFKENATAEEKFEAIQNYMTELRNLLKQNLTDDTRGFYAIVGKEDEKIKILEDSEIFAYMFVAQGKGKDNSQKETLIDFAKIINLQLDDIKNNNKSDFESNKSAFVKKFNEVKKGKGYSDAVKVVFWADAQSKSSIYGDYLTDAQKEDIQNNEIFVISLNSYSLLAVKEIGASKNPQTGENCEKTLTPSTEVPAPANKEDAGKYVDTDKTITHKPIIVDKGGNKVTTEQQVISKPGTTKVEEHTFVAKPEVPTGTITEIVTGGVIITEEYVDSDALDVDKYVDQENETYVVEQGGVAITLN